MRYADEREADTWVGIKGDWSSPYGPHEIRGDFRENFTPFATAIVRATRVAAIAQILSLICESPIEVMLGAQIAADLGLTFSDLDYLPTLIPQYRFLHYRMDFAVMNATDMLFIECDGREYHSSKEAIERDRAKDEAAARAGIELLRFTGREIWKTPAACVERVRLALQSI